MLAQLCHHPDRLNLGKEGRVLFVFQCNHSYGICNSDELEPIPKNTPKLGGLPFWHQNACSMPEGYQFAGQLSDDYHFSYPSFSIVEKYIDIYGRLKIDEKGKLLSPDAPPKVNPNSWPHPSVIVSGSVPNIYQDDQGKSYCQIGNFGGGTGYLFVKPDEKNPEVIFFWGR